MGEASEGSGTGGNLLTKYMRDINRFSLLDKEEEKSLTQEYFDTKNEKLLSKLINHNLRLVVKIAHEYRASHHNLMDLIQEGNLGLIQGIKKFDPIKNIPLASYTAYWIKAYILRSIINSAKLVKVGTTDAQRKLFFNLSKEQAKLKAAGVEVSDAELAERLGVEEKELREMKQRMEASSEEGIAEDSEKGKVLTAEGLTPEAAFEKEEFKARVRGRLEKFREDLVHKNAAKKLVVFDLRFMQDEPPTFEAIADREDMSVTKARVQQIDAELKDELSIYLKTI